MIRIKNTKTDDKGQTLLFQLILLVIIMFILALFCGSKLQAADHGEYIPQKTRTDYTSLYYFNRSSPF